MRNSASLLVANMSLWARRVITEHDVSLVFDY